MVTPENDQLQSLIRTVLSAVTSIVEELTVAAGRADIYTSYGVFEFQNIADNNTDYQAARYLGTDYVYFFGFIRDEENNIIDVQGRIPRNVWQEMVKLGVVNDTNCQIINDSEEDYIILNIPLSTLDKFVKILISAAQRMHVHTFNNVFLRPFYDPNAYMSSIFQIDRIIHEIQEKFNVSKNDVYSKNVIENLSDIGISQREAKSIQHLLRNSWRKVITAQSKEEILQTLKNMSDQLRDKYGYEFNINWDNEYEALVKSIYGMAALATHTGIVIGLNTDTNRNIKINNKEIAKHNLTELDFYSKYYNSIGSFSVNTIKAISVGSAIETADVIEKLNLPKSIKTFLVEEDYLKTRKQIGDVITFEDIKDSLLRKSLAESALAVITAVFRIGDPIKVINIQENNDYFIKLEETEDGKFIISAANVGEEQNQNIQEKINEPFSLGELLQLFNNLYKTTTDQYLKSLMSQAIGIVINIIAIRDQRILQELSNAFLDHKTHALLFAYNKQANKRLTANLLQNIPNEYKEIFGKFNVSRQQIKKVVSLFAAGRNTLDKKARKQLIKDITSYLKGNISIALRQNLQYKYAFLFTVFTILNTQAVTYYLAQDMHGVASVAKLYDKYLIPLIAKAASRKRRKYSNIAAKIKRIEKTNVLLNSSESSFLTVLEPTVDELRELMKMEKIDGLKDLWKYLLTDKSLPFYRKGDKNKFYFISGFAHAVSKHLLLAPNVDNNELEEWDKFFSWMLDELKSEYELDNDKYKKEITQAINSIYRAKQQIYAKQAILAAQKKDAKAFQELVVKQTELVNKQEANSNKPEAPPEIQKNANIYYQAMLLAQLSGDQQASVKYQNAFNEITNKYKVAINDDFLKDLQDLLQDEIATVDTSIEKIVQDAIEHNSFPFSYFIKRLKEENKELKEENKELRQKASVLERKEKWRERLDDVFNLLRKINRPLKYAIDDVLYENKSIRQQPELAAAVVFDIINDYIKTKQPEEKAQLKGILSSLATLNDGILIVTDPITGKMQLDNGNKYLTISGSVPDMPGAYYVTISDEAHNIAKQLYDTFYSVLAKETGQDVEKYKQRLKELQNQVEELQQQNVSLIYQNQQMQEELNVLHKKLREYQKNHKQLVEKLQKTEQNIVPQALAVALLTEDDELEAFIQRSFPDKYEQHYERAQELAKMLQEIAQQNGWAI